VSNGAEEVMRRIIPVLLILAACSRAETKSDGSRVQSAPLIGVAQDMSAAKSAPERQEQRQDRMIIRTANVSMIVANTSQAVEKVSAVAENAGGYVSDSRVWHQGDLLRGTLSIRVPAANLAATLAAIRRLAIRVESESLSSQEVTQEYVDLDSQLRNLRATETELLQLMRVMRERSRRASEVLEMHQQIMSIRGQIEQIEGRLRYLQQMTAMATMHVDLIPDAIAKPVIEPGWQPLVVVKDAGRALVRALQSTVNVAIWIVLYVLPIVLLIGVVLLALHRGITLVWRTRRSPIS
jgi:hypothetical protein